MKNLIALLLFVVTTSIAFAQKNEIKAIEKALKSENFSLAKSAIPAAEALLSNMDEKTKIKFYYLKAKSLFMGGELADIDDASSSLNQLKSIESKSGKSKYTKLVEQAAKGAKNSYINNASDSYENKDFDAASKGFEQIYKMSPTDTIYLYYAASAAVSGNNYDDALKHYSQLKEMKFKGIETKYVAVDKETNTTVEFPNKNARDLAVKIETHEKPSTKKTDSKYSEIIKNMALIYVANGDNEKALQAMAEARQANPDDLPLLLSEASVQLKMGNTEKFGALMEEAAEKDPNNHELQFNLGVLSADNGDNESAKKFYKKAIELNPKYNDAYINLAVAILSGESAIVDQMNALGNSAADNKKYDNLKEERISLYKEAISYLETALEQKANIDTARTLMNLYSVLGETDKFKAMKSKVESMEK